MSNACMKKIRLGFADKYPGHVPEQDYYYHLLRRHYEVEISDRPDYLICSGLGHRHIDHHCIKIADIGENIVPDFNEYDYAVGLDYLTFADRYLRIPFFTYYCEYWDLKNRSNPPSDENLLDRKFCSFVVSNGGGAAPIREKFFHELSKYKRVDSGGRYLNNVGGPVSSKREFCKQYKFNIAFENSASPGYTTEKVIEPLADFTIPIYWGNPLIERDVLPEALVVVRDEKDVARAIDEIVYLDTHDDAYLAKAKAPCLAEPYGIYEKRLEEFLVHIIEQPIEKARRVISFGYQAGMRNRLHKMYKQHDAIMKPYRMLRKLI